MLKITVDIEGKRAILELEGRLAGPWVEELRDSWQRAERDERQISVVLKQVTFIDAAGRQLLAEMRRQGAGLTAEGCMTKAIVEEIIRGEKS
jgi:anti-anti-sigma regulatory factor